MSRIKKKGNIRVWQEKGSDANNWEKELKESRLGGWVNFTYASFDGFLVPGGSPPLLIDNKEEVRYHKLLGMLYKCLHNRGKKCFS